MFKRTYIDATISGRDYKHAVVTYHPEKSSTHSLLGLTSIWLSTFGWGTADNYAKHLTAFCNYLETNQFSRFNTPEKLCQFWHFISTDDIAAWKTLKIVEKYTNKSIRPSLKSIDDSARVIARFLTWAKEEHGIDLPLWKGKTVKIKTAAALEKSILKGIVKYSETTKVDADLNVNNIPPDDDQPIEGLGGKGKKFGKRTYEYLNDDKIRILFDSFPDPVYSFISATGIHTGLRTEEVLRVPYFRHQTSGDFYSDPATLKELIRNNENQRLLVTIGKGDKIRDVPFELPFWKELMLRWMPLFEERRQKYKSRKEEELPPNILWLDKMGNPIYAPVNDPEIVKKATGKVQSAFYYVSADKKDKPLIDIFGHRVQYYCCRDTFATNYIMAILKKAKINNPGGQIDYRGLIVNMALQNDLAQRMGHEITDTTFKHYVDHAIAMLALTDEKGIFPNMERIISYI